MRAAIILIYKSGYKTVQSNYCPISLTSVICKVLERIIRKQVFSFLDQKGCMNSTQHGFKPRSFTSSMKRFKHISGFLKVSNFNNEDKTDKMSKVRFLHDYI